MGEETEVTPTIDELAAESTELAEILSSDGASSTGDVQMFPFPFCIRYDGRPQESRIIHAPDLNGAVITVNQLVSIANREASRKGFPALFSSTSGSCPDE
jgi:hypothetical protein